MRLCDTLARAGDMKLQPSYLKNISFHSFIYILNIALVKEDAEVAALLAEAYIGMDEEVKAVRVLHEAIKKHPSSYALVHVQVDFVRNKVTVFVLISGQIRISTRLS